MAFPLAFLVAAPAVEPRLRKAFSHAALESLHVAMWAKLVAAGLVCVLLAALGIQKSKTRPAD